MTSPPNFQDTIKRGTLQHLIEALDDVILEAVTPDGAGEETLNGETPILVDRIKLKFTVKDEIDRIVEPIRKALELLNAEEVLLSKRVKKQNGAILGPGIFIQPIHDEIQPRDSGIRYLCVSETDLYTLGIFVFPPNATIPLHDHPNMTVLSRVLYGDLKVKAFDNISVGNMGEPNESNETSGFFGRWMKRIVSSTIPSLLGKYHKKGFIRAAENETVKLVAPDVTMLYPTLGNIHEFTAGKNGAAVLDVLLPPYNRDHDRDCTHYEKIESGGPGEKCWMSPIPQPEWFSCKSGAYKHFEMS